MEGEFPGFDTPYVDIEQIVRGLRIANPDDFGYYVDAARSLVEGQSAAEVEYELVLKGLSPTDAQTIVATVLRVKRRKARWNGLRALFFGLFLTLVGAGCTFAAIALGMVCGFPLILILVGAWFILVGVYKMSIGLWRILAA